MPCCGSACANPADRITLAVQAIFLNHVKFIDLIMATILHAPCFVTVDRSGQMQPIQTFSLAGGKRLRIK
jgi:hypothetical protein